MNTSMIKIGIVGGLLFVSGVVFATAPRFVNMDAEGQTVLDEATALEWQEAASHDGSLDWKGALAHCTNLDYGQQTDWRVPNVRELMTLVDETKTEAPAINTTYFKSFEAKSGYWTSTTYRKSAGSAYVIYFNEQNTEVGRGGVSPILKSANASVLCVRNAE